MLLSDAVPAPESIFVMRRAAILAVAAIATSLLALRLCETVKRRQLSPERAFALAIADPVPYWVHDLQGSGSDWQGYSLFLRFNYSDEVLEFLIGEGYVESDDRELVRDLSLPTHYESRFQPEWKPIPSISTRWFHREERNTSLTHMGRHVIMIEVDSGFVYFHGSGA